MCQKTFWKILVVNLSNMGTKSYLILFTAIIATSSLTLFSFLSCEKETIQEFKSKTELKTLEGTIYKTVYNELVSDKVQNQIKENFPKPEKSF